MPIYLYIWTQRGSLSRISCTALQLIIICSDELRSADKNRKMDSFFTFFCVCNNNAVEGSRTLNLNSWRSIWAIDAYEGRCSPTSTFPVVGILIYPSREGCRSNVSSQPYSWEILGTFQRIRKSARNSSYPWSWVALVYWLELIDLKFVSNLEMIERGNRKQMAESHHFPISEWASLSLSSISLMSRTLLAFRIHLKLL